MDEIERCPGCGGGPVRPVEWHHDTAAGTMERVAARCSNCGSVDRVPYAELRW